MARGERLRANGARWNKNGLKLLLGGGGEGAGEQIISQISVKAVSSPAVLPANQAAVVGLTSPLEREEQGALGKRQQPEKKRRERKKKKISAMCKIK